MPSLIPTPAAPLVRARFCQEWLTFAQKEEEPWRSRFLDAIDPVLRETIVSSSRIGWLPVSAHVSLADVMHGAFGAARAHDYYRRAFAASLGGPVLGPFVRAGIRVLGLSVPSFVRWASRGWELAFRDVGRLVGEVKGPGHARLSYLELPAVCIASEAWLASSQGSVYGVYDVVGVDGIVRVDMSGRREGNMLLDLEWVEPS